MDIRESVETIEAGYEFLLAYAAQGRPPDAEARGPGPHARPTLEAMSAAMAHITDTLGGSDNPFEQLIADDCRKAKVAVDFVLNGGSDGGKGKSKDGSGDKAKRRGIGSEIVDNLNASIHLRTVLTDLFLYSEALEPLGTKENLQPLAHDATKGGE